MQVTVTDAPEQRRHDVRARQRSGLAVCPFVSGWIARHREDDGDLLHRSRTGVVRD